MQTWCAPLTTRSKMDFAVLDRLLERANRIELVGDSMRRTDASTKSRDAKSTTP